jgi:hypothetical protein
MAGRSILNYPEVKAAGGLAIVGTERHDSRRVDRQLRVVLVVKVTLVVCNLCFFRR